MHTSENDNGNNTRNKPTNRPAEEISGIALPKRAPNSGLFGGWGPKLLALALALSGMTVPRGFASAQPATSLRAPVCPVHEPRGSYVKRHMALPAYFRCGLEDLRRFVK